MNDQKLARIGWPFEQLRDRTFAFDEFGAVDEQNGRRFGLVAGGQGVAAHDHNLHGSRQFYAWYSIGADRPAGNLEPCKGSAPTLSALQAIRASVNAGLAIHVILDNLNRHQNREVREWCASKGVSLALAATYGSWANPIEAHFRPLRQFVIYNSDRRVHRPLRVDPQVPPLARQPHPRP